MLKEFIDAIGELKEQSLKVGVQSYDRFKDHLLLKPDGTSEVIFGDVPCRRHVAGDLACLQKLVEQHHKLHEASDAPAEATGVEVWYNRTGVTAVFDASQYRRNVATMSLELSDEIKRLGSLSGKPMTQPDIIKVLRVAFRCCDFTGAIAALRNVKFEINQSGEMETQRTKVSVSKSQMARLYGFEALQEELTFTIPVFASKFRQYFNVAAALDPDPETKTFTITPYPGQIEAAIEAAEEAVGLNLEARMPEGVPTYFGQP